MNGHEHDFGHEFVSESVFEADSDTDTTIFDILNALELRIVQTQAILFFKSMSERLGSDIKRLCKWMESSGIDFESI